MLAFDLQEIYQNASGNKITIMPMKSVRRIMGLSELPTSTSGGLIINDKEIDMIAAIELEQSKFIPSALLEQYKVLAMRQAITQQLEDGTWYAELPDFPGVWASDENSKEDALIILEEVLEDWIVIKREMNDNDIPMLDGINLN